MLAMSTGGSHHSQLRAVAKHVEVGLPLVLSDLEAQDVCTATVSKLKLILGGTDQPWVHVCQLCDQISAIVIPSSTATIVLDCDHETNYSPPRAGVALFCVITAVLEASLPFQRFCHNFEGQSCQCF